MKIRYGNISPNNTFGRIFMIFYALIGLPVNGFFFAYLGDLYSKTYIRLYRKYKTYKLSANSHYVPRKVSFIGQIVLYLIPGIVIFIFVPGVIFSYFEKWDYDVSVYYAFVTLTTIGFGDYTTTFESSQEHEFGTAFVYYQVFIILWFFSGVGYVFMILGFIAKGLAHKKVQRLEKILAHNVKETQARVWNGVTKDISYLRKILNEVYMLKFKPVYEEPDERMATMSIARSDSCPELSMYREDEPDLSLMSRKRTYSMSTMMFERSKSTVSIPSIGRRLSDSDLSRINREKTFGIQALVQPAELLAKVVTALGNITTIDEDGQSILEQASLGPGINCFTDSQILASERTWSGWSMAGSDKSHLTPPPMGRPRASSDFGLHPHLTSGNPNDWTWSGGDNVQIKELLKIRQKESKSRNNLLRTAISNSKQQFGSNLSVDAPSSKQDEPHIHSAQNHGLLQRLNPFRKFSSANQGKRNSIYDLEAPRPPVENYLAKTAKGRASMFNLSQQQYLSKTSGGRGSLLSLPPNDEQLLETTTIGDLIRALELVHTQAAMPRRGSMLPGDESPKRKNGTTVAPKMPSIMTLFANPEAAGPRRGSLRPTLSNPIQSSPHLNHPSNPPPYSVATGYSPSPKPLRRRFSVRPSSLAYPPGQCPRSGSFSMDTSISPLTSSSSSLQVPTTTLQRRLSTRPSPLASQNLLTVPSAIPVNPPNSNQPATRNLLLPSTARLVRTGSDRMVPGQFQRTGSTYRPRVGPAAATGSTLSAAAAAKRSRHSSLCQLEDKSQRHGDFS
ncbi:open rectifier potassium channel protein 1 isoform X2 [Uranotaenia lowii]|uniref:open rectifier potassium channel protein 1 isoform X2 n=1 Tax=Uranotaenia lowii TaxID=190385 RepID=UPI00247A7A37|nr:open rectifier potassium channel protein 1 isoform X2 [Uranotaenia lowii]